MMAMNCHAGSPETRDPRLWPVEGDVLKIRGRTIRVDADDPTKPTTVWYTIGQKTRRCGVFYWQANMASAEVIERTP